MGQSTPCDCHPDTGWKTPASLCDSWTESRHGTHITRNCPLTAHGSGALCIPVSDSCRLAVAPGFCPPEECLHAATVTSVPSPLAPGRALISFLSMDLPILGILQKKNDVTGDFSCPTSFIQCNVFRSIRVVAVPEPHSFMPEWQSNARTCVLSAHSSADGHGGGLHFLAGVNNSAICASSEPHPLPLL